MQETRETRRNHLGKDASASAKAMHTLCIAFGESVLLSLMNKDFCRCKQNRGVRVS